MKRLRRRFALWLCRAAGLTDIAVQREATDKLLDTAVRLEQSHAVHMKLTQTIAWPRSNHRVSCS